MHCARTIALALWLIGCTSPGGGIPRSARELDCRAIAEVTAKMLEGHVYYSRVDASLRSRVAESYLDELDPKRNLFTRSEVSSRQAQVEQIVDQIGGGNCAGLHDLEKEVGSRLSALVALARARGGSAAGPSSGEFEQLNAQNVDAVLSTYKRIDAGNAGQLVVDHYERIARRFADRDEEDAYATYLSAFARALDRDSAYLPPKALADFQRSMGSDLAGVGLALSERDESIVVERIVPGGSVDREGGVGVGDQIFAIGEGSGEPEYITGLALSDVVQRIRGRADTEVTLLVLTPGATAARRVTLKRRRVELDTQRAELQLRSVDRGDRRFEIAILTLPSFYSDPGGHQSTRDVAELLREIEAKRADGVVIDLRDNGGGRVDAALEITGLFLGGEPIAVTRDREARTDVLADRDPEVRCALPMAVLISHATAGAAEIFAAALKDHRRALVVGDDESYGRGTLQRILAMRPGLGAVKLTTAVVYAPGGRSLEGNGVQSDVSLPLASDPAPERDRRFELPHEAVTTLASVRASRSGFAAIDPGIAAELSRRSGQRAGAGRAATATPQLQVAESAEILADYLAMTTRETPSR